MPPIFLIGYMASGKTTLGRALAERHGARFADLDELIEQRAGMSVKEIFAAEGESGFRRRERAMLEELAAKGRDGGGHTVIACGGGTPCQPGNMELMNAAGVTVWLEASGERLRNRLLEGRATRPLIASLSDDELIEFAARQLEARRPHYSAAAHRFDSSLLETPDEVAATALEFFNRFLSSSHRPS